MTGHLLLALALAGSQSLGYESPYVGVKGEGQLESGRFVSVAQIAYYDSQKIETGDGFGVRGRILAGIKIGDHVTALGGITYSRQETSAWTKQGVAPTIQIEIKDDLGSLSISAERLNDSDDKQWVGALEARFDIKPKVYGRYEYVDYETLFAKGHGNRYELGLIIPLWKK